MNNVINDIYNYNKNPKIEEFLSLFVLNFLIITHQKLKSVFFVKCVYYMTTRTEIYQDWVS